jgi:hypothetical protein
LEKKFLVLVPADKTPMASASLLPIYRTGIYDRSCDNKYFFDKVKKLLATP